MWQLRLSRWPVIGAVVFALLLAGAITLYLTRLSQPTPANFLSYFPEREATVFFLDVVPLRASGVLEKLVGSTVAEDAEYKNFIAQTGFNYKRDLDRVMLNSAGAIHYFVLQGRFDWRKLEAYARQNGGKCKDDGCHTVGSMPDRIISWRRLRGDLMALASARDEAGARAIDRRSSAILPFPIPASPLWLHLPAAALRSSTQLPAGTRMFVKALEPAERTVFALGPDGDQFRLSVDVVCRNQEDAATIKAQFDSITKLLASLIRREKTAPNPDDLSGVLTSGIFERTDVHVLGRWTVRRKFLDSLGGS